MEIGEVVPEPPKKVPGPGGNDYAGRQSRRSLVCRGCATSEVLLTVVREHTGQGEER
jgi:predicted transglutaminase-like cysteine proteinase